MRRSYAFGREAQQHFSDYNLCRQRACGLIAARNAPVSAVNYKLLKVHNVEEELFPFSIFLVFSPFVFFSFMYVLFSCTRSGCPKSSQSDFIGLSPDKSETKSHSEKCDSQETKSPD